jgi:hypothetical protein
VFFFRLKAKKRMSCRPDSYWNGIPRDIHAHQLGYLPVAYLSRVYLHEGLRPNAIGTEWNGDFLNVISLWLLLLDSVFGIIFSYLRPFNGQNSN